MGDTAELIRDSQGGGETTERREKVTTKSCGAQAKEKLSSGKD